VPTFDRSPDSGFADAADTARGGYILVDASNGRPDVILMATGSEVQLAVAARERLEADDVPTRVVSMPCVEWFLAQDDAYRARVLPPAVRARVSVEAAVAQSWYQFVGDYGECVSLEHYGASAPYQVIFEQFGFTPDRVVAAARATLSRNAAIQGSTTGN
jgi:transketolase